jgi:putative copper resistance protein D
VVALAVGTTLAAAASAGAVEVPALVDPGALVRWGLPALTVLADLAAALTVGTLVLAAVALPTRVVPRKPPGGRDQRSAHQPGARQPGVRQPGVRQPGAHQPGVRPGTRRPARGPVGPVPLAHRPALVLAAVAATVWALATVGRAVLGYADVSGRRPGTPGFGGELGYFLLDLDLGRGLVVTAVVAALVSFLAAGTAGLRTTGVLAVLALVGLVPAALAGHSASTLGHETAVTSLGMHLVGVCLWVGGLAALVLLRGGLGTGLSVAATRYSRLAGWAFLMVAGSGVVNAALRIPDASALAEPYGVLVLAKAALLAALGVAGWWHRRRTLPLLAGHSSRPFLRLAAVEVAVMAVALGLAAALARTPLPIRGEPELTAAESVTGYPMPPPPSPGRWLTLWQPDLLWLVLTTLMLVLYLGGVVRLRRRGDRWPVLRTVCWVVGVAVVVYVTCGPPTAYGRVLFSGHMLAHMVLTMVAPPLLVLGAPATLALRTVRPRDDGTRGPREWLLAALESGYLRVLANPIVAAVLFAGSLVVFYHTGLFDLALRTHVGHELMRVHFLFAGYLFAWVLIGTDPGPRRPPYPFRLLLLFGTMAFHAFFGISLLSGVQVLAEEYFGSLGRPWGRGLLADQRYGGGLAWGLGEIPTLVLAIGLAVRWARSDEREARRGDRAADRDHDAELAAYNAMLAGFSRTGRPGAGTAGDTSGTEPGDPPAGGAPDADPARTPRSRRPSG